jgi:alpha-galactosidase
MNADLPRRHWSLGALTGLVLFASIALAISEPANSNAPDGPRINGPSIYGARPHHPFLYRIPATGRRPMEFTASGLPAGLNLDHATGIISGVADSSGSFAITLNASNRLGQAERKFRIVIGDRLALTPPMGWSSWCLLQTQVSDRDVRAQADALVASGLADHGYTYMEVDDGWSIRLVSSNAPPPRDSQGNLRCNERFPDMKALTDSLHQQGLKAGIYGTPGPLTCAIFAGSQDHEQQDAKQFAAWGFDLLKYDECSYRRKDDSLPEFQKPYRQMGTILAGLDRDIIFNLCQYGQAEVWKWGREVGGHTWRVSGDVCWGPKGIYSAWDNIRATFEQQDRDKCAGPGGWNDPDNLLIGYIAYVNSDALPLNAPIDRILPPPLTPDEQYTMMSLWSLLAAPLIIGGDLTRLDAFSLDLLSNDEVIAIDQDSLGRQAVRVQKDGDLSAWAKDLEDGSKAVGLFNLGDSEKDFTVLWTNLGISGKHTVRNLWRHEERGIFAQDFRARVAPHGVVLLRIAAAGN